MKNNLKIGIDLDECLSEFLFAFLNYHNDKYNTNFEKEDFKTYNLWETIGGSKKEVIKKVSEFYETDYFKNIPVVFGAFNAVSLLSRENEVFLITSRPNYMKEETKKWLDQHFPDKFSDIVFSDEWNINPFYRIFKRSLKPDICRNLNLDFMIEDNLDYAIACAKKGAVTLLLDKPWNRNGNFPNLINKVYNWNEILEEIEKKFRIYENGI